MQQFMLHRNMDAKARKSRIATRRIQWISTGCAASCSRNCNRQPGPRGNPTHASYVSLPAGRERL